MKTSAIISCHLPFNKSTKHVFNQEVFRKMERSSCVINTSRGGVIHTDDLVWFLHSGEIASAGLDVFEQEPLPVNHPIFKLKQCGLSSYCLVF